MSQRFLDALNAPTVVHFDCPATGLRIHCRCPSRFDRQSAAMAASRVWREGVVTGVTIEEYQRTERLHLLGRVCRVDGEMSPIGAEALGCLTSAQLDVYDRKLRELELQADPPLSEQEIGDAIDELKKKPENAVAILSGFDSSTLISLLLTTDLIRQETPPTSS